MPSTVCTEVPRLCRVCVSIKQSSESHESYRPPYNDITKLEGMNILSPPHESHNEGHLFSTEDSNMLDKMLERQPQIRALSPLKPGKNGMFSSRRLKPAPRFYQRRGLLLAQAASRGLWSQLGFAFRFFPQPCRDTFFVCAFAINSPPPGKHSWLPVDCTHVHLHAPSVIPQCRERRAEDGQLSVAAFQLWIVLLSECWTA